MYSQNNINDILAILSNKKILIFDLDGTIANTEPLHWEAHNVLLANYGIFLDNEHINKYIGHNDRSIYNMIKKDFEVDFDETQILDKRLDVYLSLVHKSGLQPNAFICEILRNSNAKNAIVTSQHPSVVNTLLTMWELDEYFPIDARFCCYNGEIIKRDVYSNIRNYLNIDEDIMPNDIVLFEDSQHYINEGKKCGFTVVGIEHQYNMNTLTNCDVIIQS